LWAHTRSPLRLATSLKRQDLRADSRGLTEWDDARRDGDPGGLAVGAGLSEVALPDAPLPWDGQIGWHGRASTACDRGTTWRTSTPATSPNNWNTSTSALTIWRTSVPTVAWSTGGRVAPSLSLPPHPLRGGYSQLQRLKTTQNLLCLTLENKHLLCHHGMSPDRLHEVKGAVRKVVVFCLILPEHMGMR
jgi:hypothetical protein